MILLPFCKADTSIKGQVFGSKPGFDGGSGWALQEKAAFVLAVTIWGGLGSVLDSALGGWFQASVIDSRTGKVIEGAGGKKVSLAFVTRDTGEVADCLQVLVQGSWTPANKKSDDASRRIESGSGILDNNAVNVLMALSMSIGGMVVTSYVWDVPLQSIMN